MAPNRLNNKRIIDEEKGDKMTELKTAKIVGTPNLDGVYLSILDMWPLEAQEFTRLYKFYDHLREGRYTTTKCKKCGYIAFPPGVICPKCWSDDLEWVDLPKKAKIEAFTVSKAGVPQGFPEPLIMASLSFEKGSPIRMILGRIINCPEDKVKQGDEVKLVVFEVPAHPMDYKRESKIMERVYYAWELINK